VITVDEKSAKRGKSTTATKSSLTEKSKGTGKISTIDSTVVSWTDTPPVNEILKYGKWNDIFFVKNVKSGFAKNRKLLTIRERKTLTKKYNALVGVVRNLRKNDCGVISDKKWELIIKRPRCCTTSQLIS